MGQTLPNGIYLPAEGERNCYDGLEGNWRSLDSLISTVAGKASATHTHGNISSDGKVGTTANLPLITGTGGVVQAGSFGTSANTFCEGNDSRLSDARTPVAHTHTKSDITDLFNSANTWSANNIYTYAITLKQTNLEEGVLPASNQTKRFGITDKNNANLGWLQHRINTSGDSYLEFYVVNKFSNGQLSSQGSEIANVLNLGLHSDGSRYFTVTGDVYPDLPTRVCNLGTSTNKWKTLNGVNPGALSLPNINYTEGSPDVYNVGTDINNLTKNTTDPLHFSWTSPFDGWLAIMWYLKDLTPPFNVLVTSNSDARASKFSQTWSASSARWYLATTFPVVKNVTYYFDIDFQNTTIGVVHHAYLLPCLGNV